MNLKMAFWMQWSTLIEWRAYRSKGTFYRKLINIHLHINSDVVEVLLLPIFNACQAIDLNPFFGFVEMTQSTRIDQDHARYLETFPSEHHELMELKILKQATAQIVLSDGQSLHEHSCIFRHLQTQLNGNKVGFKGLNRLFDQHLKEIMHFCCEASQNNSSIDPIKLANRSKHTWLNSFSFGIHNFSCPNQWREYLETLAVEILWFPYRNHRHIQHIQHTKGCVPP